MAKYGNDVYFQFEGEIERTTPKAILFKADMWDHGEWLPRSQVQFSGVEDGRVTMKIKQWLCEKNGWSETGEEDMGVDDRMKGRDLDDEIPF